MKETDMMLSVSRALVRDGRTPESRLFGAIALQALNNLFALPERQDAVEAALREVKAVEGR